MIKRCCSKTHLDCAHISQIIQFRQVPGQRIADKVFLYQIFQPMLEQIEAILDEIRPNLAMHKGNVELVDVDEENGVISVKFLGGCEGCPMSQITLKMGIEMYLQDKLPWLKEVRAVN